MSMPELPAVLRKDAGKESNRRRRAAGKIPGIVYGKNLPSRSLEFDRRELERFLVTARRGTVVVKMKVSDGAQEKESFAVLKEVQTDPRSARVVHVDFYEVAAGRKFRVEVPLKLKGKAAGIEQGGILEQMVRSLEVECTPDDVPSVLEADVSALGIGDAIHLSDVRFPVGVRPVEKDLQMPVAAVHAPKIEEVAAPAPVEGEAAPAEGASVAETEEKDKDRDKDKSREK